MSTINHQVIADRLTRNRLRSYLQTTHDHLATAIERYDWNARVGAALQEDLGRLEVIFRNAIDEALVNYGSSHGWQRVWYERKGLFPGGKTYPAVANIAKARQRATNRWTRPESHGRVIAALGFGFWRYLCEPHHFTSLWVPALASVFAQHPSRGNPRQIRADVADRMQRLHFLRNRIAHHEPIHQRNLARDHAQLLEVVGWICPDSHTWVAVRSQTPTVIATRP